MQSLKELDYTKGDLLVHELDSAEGILCRQTQLECFAEDYENLKTKNQKMIKKELIKLAPYLDEKGLMRVYSRIDNAPTIPIFTKRPIILPKQHHLSCEALPRNSSTSIR